MEYLIRQQDEAKLGQQSPEKGGNKMGYRGKNTAKTVCPYYLLEGEKKIKCEGFMEGTDVTINFVSSLQKEYYQETKCGNLTELCPIRILAAKKYKGDAT